MLRKTAASAVAASAILLGSGTAQAQPAPEQVVQAVADSAAETYRQARDEILRQYRAETAAAQRVLESADDLDQAWQEYKEATAGAGKRAHAALEEARETFRTTVALVRGQGVKAMVRRR